MIDSQRYAGAAMVEVVPRVAVVRESGELELRTIVFD
ncbi:hypothetical protein PPSIR1_26903 [Plesiocystis pacifica SIR-1]|uniref:Uncharacterized protein n=1 Tax=Plesiocystis pacifica SIR-1 TaxID=391625 RepID=A6GD84_9BACT|nr:hypothetical protein PPSIR1_26903 [Plesiocystis pacifica SIR-1]